MSVVAASEVPLDLPPALQVLVDADLVTVEQATAALTEAATANTSPIKVLTASGVVSSMNVLRATATAEGHKFVDITETLIEPEMLTYVPARVARQLNVVPLGFTDDGILEIAVSPAKIRNPLIRDDLSRALGSTPFVLIVAMRKAIEDRIGVLYRSEGELSELSDQIAQSSSHVDEGTVGETIEASEDSAVVKAVNLLINQAIADGASDIHVDPGETTLTIRYRIDDVLKVANTFPKAVQNEFISRVKIMCELDPAQRRVPQDGRMSVTTPGGRRIDLRVATLPTVWGEKVVMRILDNSNTRLSLSDLGFSPQNEAIFKRAYVKPYGMILITGPTGSGKSTTLYATLNQVSTPEINVITVENPVEYRIPGIAQVQTNDKAGLTFSVALRSILRSDPNVVLIGEMRDHETAHIAMEASLTGHLVMSTLHTNDAPAAITRLTEMGIEPFLVGSALDAVLAQRLCRRLCSKCKESYTPDPALLDSVGFPYDPDDLPVLYRPKGCRHCTETGYKGRMGLHEIMEVDATVERMTVEGASLEAITKYAISNGMTPLRQDGWWKVGLGLTAIEEILRVVV